MLTLGIDIGGTSVKLAMLRDGHAVWRAQSPFYQRPATDALIAAIQQAARGLELHPQRIGLCVPGLLDEQRRIVTLSVNVPGLMHIPLEDLLRRALDLRAPRMRVVNDAFATGFDVTHELKLAGRSVVLALGTGVGMAVLDDGKPIHLDADSPGHIGQVDVSLDADPPVGPDHGAGSLEAYIGASALARRFGSVERFLQSTDPSEPPLRALARAIRIIHAIYRPNHVVLAGGIGIRLSRVLAPLKQMVDTNLTSIARGNWSLKTGAHDFHGAQGAARCAIEAP